MNGYTYFQILPPDLRKYFYSHYIKEELLPVITDRAYTIEMEQHAAYYCVQQGYLKILQSLKRFNRKDRWSIDRASLECMMHSAISHNQLAILQWLYRYYKTFHTHVGIEVASPSNMQMKRFLYNNTLLYWIVKADDAAMLQWYYQEEHFSTFKLDMTECIREDRINVAIWLHQHKVPILSSHCMKAAFHKRAAFLHYAWKCGSLRCYHINNLIIQAIEVNDLSTVAWLETIQQT